MSVRGIFQLPVVTPDNRRKLIGILRQKDIIAAYDKALLRQEIAEEESGFF